MIQKTVRLYSFRALGLSADANKLCLRGGEAAPGVWDRIMGSGGGVVF
jgi:hypothetical protein